jgi:hypothetical protein
MPVQRSQALVLEAIALVALLAWSGAQPYDRPTWAREVFPVVVALPLLWATYRRFPFTTLTYVLVAIFAIILMVGGRVSRRGADERQQPLEFSRVEPDYAAAGAAIQREAAHVERLEQRLNGNGIKEPALHGPDHGVWHGEDFSI